MDVIILVGQIIIGLLLLTFLVVIHELGHAIVARRNDVEVEEFGIGFPPKAWARKWATKLVGKKTVWSINWLPLGGFVKLKGESDDAKDKGSYGAAPLWAKTKILLAGVGVNWLFAAIAFTILALIGFPKVLPDQFHIKNDAVITQEPLKIAYIEKGSPADKAGLELNNQLRAANGKALKTPEDLVTFTKENKGKTITLEYSDGYATKEKEITLRSQLGKNQGVLGVQAQSQSTIRSTWSAPIVGVGNTIQFSVVTVVELGKLVVKLSNGLVGQLSGDKTIRNQANQQVNEAGASVAGPIGILGVIFPAAQKAGIVTLLFLMGVISLTLAVMNALPIPALDGGRLFVTLLFRALKKPLRKETEEKIHGAGFSFLMLLVVVITVADVAKFF